MSEDSSSDEEWCVSTKRHGEGACPEAKCWECGKKFSSLSNLMLHYKNHNITAACHICNVIFRRLTSLSTHLDNAHSPPLCNVCHQSFSNVWELNKHAETHRMDNVPFQQAPAFSHQSRNSNNCSNEMTAPQSINSVLYDSVLDLSPEQTIEVKTERAESLENSVEFIVGEDDDKDFDTESDWGQADDSTSSTSDDSEDERPAKPVELPSDGPESVEDSNSSSTDCSSNSSNSSHTKKNPVNPPPTTTTASSICARCGRGPFRSVKLHLLHCNGVRVKYQCSLCKKLFLSEPSLKEHYMPLYCCDVCGQVFSHENSYNPHQCPKRSKCPVVFFCCEIMPKACNICKSFFTSEKTLLNHVTSVHTSVVSTKIFIITQPSALTGEKVSPGVPGTAAQFAIRTQNPVSQVINGKLLVGQNYAGSLSTVVKSAPSSLSTSSFHPGRPPAPMCVASAAAPVRLGRGGARGRSTHKLPSCLSKPLLDSPAATDTTSATVAPEPVSRMPTIMAMFENDSQDVALMKRMNMGWRAKASYPCRQCGAILRQPSLIISHRYLHRGRRSHRCQCGRAFKHRLHLLRHCVQHAESKNYICVSCGETFTGVKLLAEHLKGRPWKKSHFGHTLGKVKKKCRMPFTCHCGQYFFRPSAYIWHQLQNWKKKT